MPLSEGPSRPDNYDQKLNEYLAMRNDRKTQMLYRGSLTSLFRLAAGKDVQMEDRLEWEGWTKSDAEALLTDLNEEF